jgi:hypothetical protein
VEGGTASEAVVELQVPEWVAGAGIEPAEAEKDVGEHRDSLVIEVQEVGLLAQRWHVDQPNTQTKGRAGRGQQHYHELLSRPPMEAHIIQQPRACAWVCGWSLGAPRGR